MNKLLERLKAHGTPANPLLRMLYTDCLTVGYDDESDGLWVMGQDGEIWNSEQFKELIEGVSKFHEYLDDETIREINAERERRQQAKAAHLHQDKPVRKSSVGYVYLIRAENGLYKIGKAKNVSARMQPFSVHFPMKWELIHSVKSDDYSYTEEFLHQKFADKRDVGEWFRLTPADVAYITAL